MKRKQSTIILFLLVALLGCSNSYKNLLAEEVKKISNEDIANFIKKLDDNPKRWWIGEYRHHKNIVPGIVRLKNGQIVKCAFISHHLTEDRQSYSYFEADGYSRFVKGWFCCSVEFSGVSQPESLTQFDALLCKYDGVSP